MLLIDRGFNQSIAAVKFKYGPIVTSGPLVIMKLSTLVTTDS